MVSILRHFHFQHQVRCACYTYEMNTKIEIGNRYYFLHLHSPVRTVLRLYHHGKQLNCLYVVLSR